MASIRALVPGSVALSLRKVSTLACISFKRIGLAHPVLKGIRYVVVSIEARRRSDPIPELKVEPTIGGYADPEYRPAARSDAHLAR